MKKVIIIGCPGSGKTTFAEIFKTEVCVQGAIERLGKTRYDMPWIDTTLDPKLEQEIRGFPDKVLPRIYELLVKYRTGKQVVVFKSRVDTDEYLNRI